MLSMIHMITRKGRLLIKKLLRAYGQYKNRDGPQVYHRRDGPQWYQYVGCVGPPEGTGPPPGKVQKDRAFSDLQKPLKQKIKKFRRYKMKTLISKKLLALTAMILVAAAPTAFADGTQAGINITNSATLSYQIGGSPQSTPSNTTDFEVDQLVNFVVAEVGADVHADTIGQPVVARFQLTHFGNQNQRFVLAPINLAPGETVTFVPDTFTDSQTTAPTDTNVTGFELFEDDGDGIFNAGDANITATPFVELAQSASGGTAQTIWVRATLPASAPSGENAVISLVVTAEASGGGALTADIDGDDPTLVEIVFGEPDGPDDGVRDGIHSARDVMQVQNALVTVVKTATTIWDPVNAGIGGVSNPGNPYALPGSYVRYSIVITNDDAATSAANLTDFTDVLVNTVDADVDLIVNNCDNTTVTACATEAGGVASDAADAGIRVSVGTSGCSPANAPPVARSPATLPAYYTSAADADIAGFTYSGPGPDTYTLTVDLDGVGTILAADASHTSAGDLLPCETVTIEFNAIVE